MTKRDRGRARGMLRRMVEEDVEVGMGAWGLGDNRPSMKRCFQTMLMLGVKAEIQAVDGELCRWLEKGMVTARGY